MQTIDFKREVKKVEKATGKKMSKNKQKYALASIQHPEKNPTELAREISGAKNGASQYGSQLAKDPQVIALQDKIQDLDVYKKVKIDVDLIKRGLLKEALNANQSRDRTSAWNSLGKSEGAFKEVIEHRDMRADQEFLDELAAQLGEDAAITAAEELGLEWERE